MVLGKPPPWVPRLLSAELLARRMGRADLPLWVEPGPPGHSVSHGELPCSRHCPWGAAGTNGPTTMNSYPGDLMPRGREWYKQPPGKQRAGRVMSAALLAAVTVEPSEALSRCTMQNLLEGHSRAKASRSEGTCVAGCCHLCNRILFRHLKN